MPRCLERTLFVLLLGGIALVPCALPTVGQTASLTGPVPAAQRPASSTPEYVRAGKLLDVRSGKMLDDRVIVVRGGRIERVALAREEKIPPGARFVDLSQAT